MERKPLPSIGKILLILPLFFYHFPALSGLFFFSIWFFHFFLVEMSSGGDSSGGANAGLSQAMGTRRRVTEFADESGHVNDVNDSSAIRNAAVYRRRMRFWEFKAERRKIFWICWGLIMVSSFSLVARLSFITSFRGVVENDFLIPQKPVYESSVVHNIIIRDNAGQIIALSLIFASCSKLFSWRKQNNKKKSLFGFKANALNQCVARFFLVFWPMLLWIFIDLIFIVVWCLRLIFQEMAILLFNLFLLLIMIRIQMFGLSPTVGTTINVLIVHLMKIVCSRLPIFPKYQCNSIQSTFYLLFSVSFSLIISRKWCCHEWLYSNSC